MKMYKIEDYINGSHFPANLIIEDRNRELPVLSPRRQYPPKFVRDFLGVYIPIEYGQSGINARDLIEEGLCNEVLQLEATVIDDFYKFKKGDTVYFRKSSDPSLKFLAFSQEELSQGAGYSSWEKDVDKFVMKAAPLSDIITMYLKWIFRLSHLDIDDREEHYNYVRGNLIRGLKLAEANNIFLDLEWFEKELETDDLIKDWTLTRISLNDILTYPEAIKVIKSGGSVKDESGMIYTDVNQLEIDDRFYERNN